MSETAAEKKWAQVAVLGTLFGGLSFLFWQTSAFEPVDLGAGIGPALWTRVILGLALFLILLQIYWTIKSAGPSLPAERVNPGEPASRILTRLAITVGYVVAIPFLGFFWASPLFLFITLSYFGRHGMREKILVSILVTLSILIIYTTVLYVPLPKGTWVFEDASNFLLAWFFR